MLCFLYSVAVYYCCQTTDGGGQPFPCLSYQSQPHWNIWVVILCTILPQEKEQYELHQNGGLVCLDVFLQILLRLRAQKSWEPKPRMIVVEMVEKVIETPETGLCWSRRTYSILVNESLSFQLLGIRSFALQLELGTQTSCHCRLDFAGSANVPCSLGHRVGSLSCHRSWYLNCLPISSHRVLLMN